MSIKKLIILASGILIIFLIYLNSSYIHEKYLFFFKQTGTISHYNAQGQLYGESLTVVNGIIQKRTNFSDGLKNGWETEYYPDGKIKHKSSYANDIKEGPEYGYYENGNLQYTANVKYGVQFGSMYRYLENDRLDSYSAYNVNGKRFCTFHYNQAGSIIKTDGYIVDPYIYTIDAQDSVTVLDFNLQKAEGYHNIRDLYVVTVTPPNYTLKVHVKINNVVLDKTVLMNDNVAIIRNAFTTKGIYGMSIETRLFDKQNKEFFMNGVGLTIKKD